MATYYSNRPIVTDGLVLYHDFGNPKCYPGNNDTIVNGGFDADSDWVKGTGWNIEGGSGSYDISNFAVRKLHQPGKVIAGQSYKVTYTVVNYVTGAVRCELGKETFNAVYTSDDPSNGIGTRRSANGTYTETIVADGISDSIAFANDNSGDNDWGIDNVSMIRVSSYDLSGNGHSGSFIGDQITGSWSSDNLGSVYVGPPIWSSFSDEYINFGLPSGLDFPSTSTFTLSVWCVPYSISASSANNSACSIFGRGDFIDAVGIDFKRNNTGAGVSGINGEAHQNYSVSFGSRVNDSARAISVGITTGSVYNFTFSFDAPGAKSFVNGRLMHTNTSNSDQTGSNFDTSPGWKIGSQTFLGGDRRPAEIRYYSVMLYNRGLTEQEVKQNFNALRGRFGI